MKRILSIFLLILLITFPVVLLVVSSYMMKAHPLESTIVSTEHFLHGSDNDLEIVFFGFVGCASVCPSSLQVIGSVVDSFNNSYKKGTIGASFIDVNVSSKHTSEAHRYSQLFSKNIKGYNLSAEELKKVKSEFSLNVINNRYHKTVKTHTDHYFILKKQSENWYIHRVLNNDSSREILKNSIDEVLTVFHDQHL